MTNKFGQPKKPLTSTGSAKASSPAGASKGTKNDLESEAGDYVDLIFGENLSTPRLNVNPPEYNKIENRRLAPRAPISGGLILHDQSGQLAGKGIGINISTSGIGLSASNMDLELGQTVTVEYIGCKNLPAFNALCEVVRFQEFDQSKSEATQMGLRILKMSRLTLQSVDQYVAKVHDPSRSRQA